MKSLRTLTMLALALAAFAPLASAAQTTIAQAGAMGDMHPPTKDQVETALKATKPTIKQMRAMKPMLDTYKSQVASATDESSKQAATKQLVGGMKTVLSPSQQMAFKQSLMSQMSAAH